MTVLQSIFLGLLQGLTEFLPVSSSGHLFLAQKLFNLQADLFFDVMLHVGTLLAVLISFRKSIWHTVRHPLADVKLRYLLLASVATVAIALPIKLFVSEKLMYDLLPIGFAASIVLIVLSEKLSKPKLRLQYCGVLPVIITGLTQGVAVFPGLSRSGATVCTMKLFGVNASDSAEFSFLLSVPIILGGAAVEAYQAIKLGVAINWICVAAGTFAAFLSGLASSYLVMRTVKNKSWIWFAVYLVIPLTISLITM